MPSLQQVPRIALVPGVQSCLSIKADRFVLTRQSSMGIDTAQLGQQGTAQDMGGMDRAMDQATVAHTADLGEGEFRHLSKARLRADSTYSGMAVHMVDTEDMDHMAPMAHHMAGWAHRG